MATFEEIDETAEETARRERLFTRINKAEGYLNAIGLAWLVPILRIAAGDTIQAQAKELWQLLAIPALGIAVFLAAWAWLAPMVQTSLGAVPGPAQVWEQVIVLADDHARERKKEEAFYERQDKRNAKFAEAGKADKIKHRNYTGKPT